LEKEEKTKIAITKTKEFQMRNFYKLDYDEQALKVISSFLFLITMDIKKLSVNNIKKVFS
jgi:hypothetical protein